MVSPAYRMIPESHATDTLNDISDFWTWLHEPGTLTSAIQSRFPSLTPDLDHVATIGESAGGYLALQSTLSLDPARTKIRVAMAQYPALFSDLPAWNTHPEEPDPALDKVVADYVQALEPGKIRVSTPWPGLQEVVFAMLRNGLMREFGLGKHERLTAEYAIAKAKGFGRVPPIWIIQGTEDHLVTTAATDQLVSRLRAELSDLKLKYTVQPGDHGFDCFSKLEDDWVAEGVDWIKGFWL
jgi:acetyl esterase/lipase